MPMHPSDIHAPQRQLANAGLDPRKWQFVYDYEWDGDIGSVKVHKGVTCLMPTINARSMCAAQGGSLAWAFCVDPGEPGDEPHVFIAGHTIPDDAEDMLVDALLESLSMSDLDPSDMRAPRVFLQGDGVGHSYCERETWQELVAELREDAVATAEDAAGATPTPDGAPGTPEGKDGAVGGATGGDGPPPLQVTQAYLDAFGTKAELAAWAIDVLNLDLDLRDTRDAMEAAVRDSGRVEMVEPEALRETAPPEAPPESEKA